VRYVEQLIGPDTVNTVPPDTLQRFEEHGTVARTLADDPSAARATLGRLAALGIDFDDVTATLEDEGIRKFAASYEQVLRVIARKRERLAADAPRATA
jgi:transaldolase